MTNPSDVPTDDRDELERRLRACQQRVRELQRGHDTTVQTARAHSEDLGHLAHALRTPLNAIIGFAEIMEDERAGPLAPPYKEFAGDILSSARDLSQILVDALELARLQAGLIEFQAEQVRLPTLLAEVCDALTTRLVEKDLEVRIEVDPAVTNVVLDPARLGQVLRCYLLSAIALSRPAGTIALSATPQEPSQLRLEVRDAGDGMTPEELAGLFVAFNRLPGTSGRQQRDAGAGLALARRVVEAQGGSVEVYSAPGSNTRFAALLPRHRQQT